LEKGTDIVLFPQISSWNFFQEKSPSLSHVRREDRLLPAEKFEPFLLETTLAYGGRIFNPMTVKKSTEYAIGQN